MTNKAEINLLTQLITEYNDDLFLSFLNMDQLVKKFIYLKYILFFKLYIFLR